MKAIHTSAVRCCFCRTEIVDSLINNAYSLAQKDKIHFNINLAKKLTNYIFEKGIITEDGIEIYQYGFQCFLELSASTICSIIIALLLGMLPECLFFFLLFIPIRSFGGGLHMKTYFACFIGSCFILTSTLLAVKYLTFPLLISFVVYISAAILILVIGPVDHPNREVDAQDNHTFIKRTQLY